MRCSVLSLHCYVMDPFLERTKDSLGDISYTYCVNENVLKFGCVLFWNCPKLSIGFVSAVGRPVLGLVHF